MKKEICKACGIKSDVNEFGICRNCRNDLIPNEEEDL